MKYMLATKQGMTRFFDETGRAYSATLLNAGPVVVTQVKSKESDGYTAVQVGFGEKKRITKPLRGHLGDLGSFRHMREFRLKEEGDTIPKRGDSIDVSIFEAGKTVTISGITKGRGFQGVVKRYGFAGGPRTHGQKHSEREGGSIGATGPQEVLKGTKMPGRMGGDRVTVKNLKVLAIDKKNGKLLVSGAVPGRAGTLVEIRG